MPRPTAAVMTVRTVVFVTGTAAILLAVPAGYRLDGRVMAVAGAVAGIAALVPRTAWVDVVEYSAVAVWVGATVVEQVPVEVPALFGIAVMLYLHHTFAAMAAALPVNAEVVPQVLTNWAWRAGAVLVVSGVAGIGVLLLPRLVQPVSSPIAPLVALAAASLIGVTLAFQLRRRG